MYWQYWCWLDNQQDLDCSDSGHHSQAAVLYLLKQSAIMRQMRLVRLHNNIACIHNFVLKKSEGEEDTCVRLKGNIKICGSHVGDYE